MGVDFSGLWTVPHKPVESRPAFQDYLSQVSRIGSNDVHRPSGLQTDSLV